MKKIMTTLSLLLIMIIPTIAFGMARSPDEFGKIIEVFKDDETVLFVLEKCDGAKRTLRTARNFDTWTEILEKYKLIGDLVQVKVYGDAVDGVALITGANCDNLPKILESLKEEDEEEVSIVNTSYDDDRFEEKKEQMEERIEMQKEKTMEMKARFQRLDDKLLMLQETTGYEPANPLKFHEKDTTERQVKLYGKLVIENEKIYILNLDGKLIAEVDFKNGFETAKSFDGKTVVVEGNANRDTRVIRVDRITLAEGYVDNSAEVKWKIGASLYKDVDSEDKKLWYAKHLRKLYDKGIITGYKDGSFGGENFVTIAEISKMVLEASGSGEFESEVEVEAFEKHWARGYLHMAKKKMLIDRIFAPNESATRLEVITAILKAFEVEITTDMVSPFSDTNDSYILTAYKLGVVSGYDDKTFRPDSKINRAEVAKIISNMIDIFGNEN